MSHGDAGPAMPVSERPPKPSALAIAALALGGASWVVLGWCGAVPGVLVAVIELVRIHRGHSPAAGKSYAWVGLAASVTHIVVTIVLLIVFFGAVVALLETVGLSPFSEPCAGRTVCIDEGQCGTSRRLTGDASFRCYVRDGADCASSSACAREGRCHYDPRVSLRCISADRVPVGAPLPASVCEESSDCARWGRCAVVEGACLATREEDCDRSLECVVAGRCTLSDHTCVVASDVDCAASLECAVYGRCAQQAHPLLGAASSCTVPGALPPTSCNYTGAGADRCALTDECLTTNTGACETLDQHGRDSPALVEARRRIREAVPVEEPVSAR